MKLILSKLIYNKIKDSIESYFPGFEFQHHDRYVILSRKDYNKKE